MKYYLFRTTRIGPVVQGPFGTQQERDQALIKSLDEIPFGIWAGELYYLDLLEDGGIEAYVPEVEGVFENGMPVQQ